MNLGSLPGWYRRAACRGADIGLFFIEGQGHIPKEARALCSVCPVRQKCLDYAVPDPSIRGVWGGTSERQRKRLRLAAGSTEQSAPGGPQSPTVRTASPAPSATYRGVQRRRSGRYQARLRGRNLGHYDTAEEAAAAVERARGAS